MYFDPDSSSFLDSFDATNIRVIVEGNQYTIHRFFLSRDSPVLREMFSAPLEVAQEDATYTLSGVTKEEFEHLLWVYYNPSIDYYLAPIAVWRDILKLAEMWKMTRVGHIAQKHLRSAPLDPIEKIKLCERDRYEAREAYIQVCTRKEGLSVTEFQALGMDLVLLIMQIRERIIANRQGPEVADEAAIVEDMIGRPSPQILVATPVEYC
ncbi:BTB domain-containing protein [Mycena venus]|uniref:BTB domain-containing protein n=1 Tax=Mycena venus TaxID=2733690 RepID=A0A8H6XKL2_9AGAR|nr:BTB domain-containing protein [Mycena venus]